MAGGVSDQVKVQARDGAVLIAAGSGADLQPQFTVHVVDDDPSVRSALSRLFRSVGHGVMTFESALAYLEDPPNDGPGCLVLDINMPGMDGLSLQDQMSERGLEVPIIFISGQGDIPSSVRAMKGGAVDFIEKPFQDDDLLDAVNRAAEVDTESRLRQVATSQIARGLERLTPREFEVMTWVIAGRLNKVIANELGVSEKTVKVHRGRVMNKMEAGSLADLVRMTERAGIPAAKPDDSRSVV